MLVMVVDGKFHKTYEEGYLVTFRKKNKHLKENSIYFRQLVHSHNSNIEFYYNVLLIQKFNEF